MQTRTKKPTYNNLAILFLITFFLRASTFFFYVQHEERFRQADSPDYHSCAISMALDMGMHRFHNKQPIFWRTPGYPLYLSYFYKYFGLKTARFEDNHPAQKAAIWLQIILDSFIPIIIFFLSLTLVDSLLIARITAWICSFHLGFILASTYLLTEALALIFFFLFLLFYYKSFHVIGEPKYRDKWKFNLFLSALFLGITTWIRPMGEFVFVVTIIILLLLGSDDWKLKLKKTSFFFLIFFISISPWYIRNHNLTGKIFFCPMSGLYLNSFIAPRVIRDIENIPLEKAWREQQQKASAIIQHEAQKFRWTSNVPVGEMLAGKAAWPVIFAHPFWAAYEWVKEVFKTTFDLYSSQLVNFVTKCYKWDPLEEFLLEKIASCLFGQPMPLFMRLICWIEFFYSLALWFGLLSGAYFFLIKPLFKKFNVPLYIKKLGGLWLKTLFMIGSIVFMTGGFGYARLRLPIEPLLIVLALTAWFYILKKKVIISV